jgi:hypothetical protein
MNQDKIKTIILEDGSKFYIAFDSDRKPCKYCRKIIHWGYMSNGRAASVEENEGKFRLHFPQCTPLHQRRYHKEYVQLTNGVDTEDRKLTSIRIERRRYVR